ncbi:hypothetical protein ScPMuIL_001392 [Solemya velum]
MRFSDRRKVTRDKGLCDNCLQEGHFGRGCMKKGACEIHDCRRKHHTLLHFQNPEYKSDTRYKNDNVHVNRIQNYPSTEKVSTDRHCTATVSGKRVCLRIVPVQVEGVYSSIKTYALLDEGSDVSLCSNSLVERLGIKGIEKTFTITTVSAEETVNTGQEIKLSISALDNSESVKLNKVWTVDKIPTSPESIPRQSDIANWSHLKGLEFPEIDEKEVTILIGSDIPEVFWVQEERRGRRKEPYAIRSILGWTLMGPVGNTTQSDRFSVNYTKCQDEMLFKQVEMFWKADFGDTLDSKPGLSLEDKQALNIMEKSVTYVDGHYQLELPWRHSSVCLPNNVELAEMRLQQLKRRFQRDATLLDKYTNTMQDGDFSKDPETYQMTVHLFGATSSPSCANFSLRKTAQDNSEDFDSEIVNTVLRNFYVDDCLKSVETKSEGIKLVEQLCALLNRGGFRLTKWVSNDMDVLAKIPMNERARSLVNLDMQDISVEHALGVLWNVKTDKFQFDTVKKTKPATRRGVLSIVSSLYDPLGFMSPCILPAKILLQSLCKMKIGWDTEMGCEEIKVWKCWLDGLSELTHLNVDRCFKHAEMSQYSEVQLHHFADASQSAYGAVSYLRLLDENGAVHCSFVMGKSRLAPLKSLTIPRLELMAAVLAVKLDKLIKSELDMCVDKTVFWTDSMIVLQYILSESRRFQTFVANRLAMIHEGSNRTQWNHVKSEANPADCASRGLKPIETKKLKKWLNGPEFLWQEERFWLPQPNCINEVSNQDVELKRETKVSFATQSNGLDKLMGFFSTWTRLQRTIAWFLRYKQYCCHRYLKKGTESEIIKGDLIVEELKMATLEVVAYVQRLNFSKEISLLSKCNSNRQESKDNYKVVGPSSPLRKLSPVLVDGILRVGGRLNKAPLSYETKHPYILPNKCHVTELIIPHEHSLVGHLGPVYVLSSLRKFVWILKGHAAVRRVIGNCFQCKRQKAKRGEQYMAELPVERLTPERPPFTHVGVDYFGPLQVKRARSCVKRYGCLFTCLATRALHIEIAHSLETDSFIAALHRFISRRGRPEAIFSDNGSNFKGADRELRDALKTWNQCKISKVLCLQEIQWHFNTPTASHMGGVWERLIRSVRQILRVMLKEQLVSDETLLTVMAEVEKILNDRPLTFVSDDPDDPRPLTPATLLLLKPNSSIPETVCVPADGYCKKIWRQAQYLSDLFWRRWINEYLPTLQLRQKWTECNRNFCVNDIVLVIDEKTVRGWIWHVTDFHWDFTYDDRRLSCREYQADSSPFGNYSCDSTWRLCHEAVNIMKSTKPGVDFILWTGDSVPHSKDADLNLTKRNDILTKITSLLSDAFPDIPIYPTFGNNDYWPTHQFPSHGNALYNLTLENWKQWINDTVQANNFLKGAYYTVKNPHGLRIIAMNTNLYYTSNKMTKDMKDPADQFQWLEHVLSEAAANNEKVLVTGHVPPGVYAPGGFSWMYKQFNEAFNDIMIKHSDVIVGLHFGHTHADLWSLYRNSAGEPVVPVFMAPSVTPLRYKISAGGHNPAVRLIKYDRDDGSPLDISNYYMDLDW